MKNPLLKLGLLLVFILLPAIILSVYELSSLNENEKTIESIYSRQLDAILFSANQYSSDIANSWANKCNFVNDDRYGKEIQTLLRDNPINTIFTADTFNINNINFFDHRPDNQLLKNVSETLEENKSIINRLYSYKKAGYRKLESLQLIGSKLSLIVFVLGEDSIAGKLCGIVINPEEFIKSILSPKLQEISGEEFIVSVFSTINNKIIYSTGEAELAHNEQQKPIWLFPEFNLGIMLKGPTIENLIKSRTKFNLYLIILMNIVLIAGFLFVYRNVRKEIQLAQIKSDFVSNVSHELRTPLSLISMFAETLELGRVKSEEKKQEYYSIISHETSRLSNIVNKILNFSRIEAGKVKYNLEPVDLNILVDKIVANYNYHIRSNGFKMDFFRCENDLTINADSEAVSEAVINLIDNAIKYSSNIKYIKVTTGEKSGDAFVEVTDYGIGISHEDQKKIFEKFFRVSSGLVHNTKGTGLGLTLVKYIIDAHKGKIELESEPGKGSSFKLIFQKLDMEKS